MVERVPTSGTLTQCAILFVQSRLLVSPMSADSKGVRAREDVKVKASQRRRVVVCMAVVVHQVEFAGV